MKRYLLLAVSLLAFHSSNVVADKVPKDVQAEVDAILKRHSMPGGVAAIVENGKVTLKVASGVRKKGKDEPFSVNDKIHIGSCTKAMTATLVGILIDEGKLSWDTKIIDVFPEFADQIHEEYRAVTISQLLSHYAGAPANVAWRALGPGDPLREQRLTMLRKVFFQPPEHPPGKTYHYSNVGYVAAGAMLEKITGESWEDLITARLFEPLEMKSAGFGPPSIEGAIDQPWGHVELFKLQIPVQIDNAAVLGPAGAVHLTVDDWGRFASLHAGTGTDEQTLLKPETLAHLQTPFYQFDPRIVAEQYPYGFGWISTERDWGKGKVIFHSGSNTAWFATIWLAPNKKTTFIAAVNSGASENRSACNEMVAELIRHWSANPEP